MNRHVQNKDQSDCCHAHVLLLDINMQNKERLTMTNGAADNSRSLIMDKTKRNCTYHPEDVMHGVSFFRPAALADAASTFDIVTASPKCNHDDELW